MNTWMWKHSPETLQPADDKRVRWFSVESQRVTSQRVTSQCVKSQRVTSQRVKSQRGGMLKLGVFYSE